MTSPWWDPARHADRKPLLAARGRVRAALRDWFAARGFTEVECGALQVSPGNEAHLHAFATTQRHEDGSAEQLYLHTSPEFAAKKLLAAGETRIFDFARVYRNAEGGALHAAEFTMLEWYRAGEAWDAVMRDAVDLARAAQVAGGMGRLEWRGVACDAEARPERLTLVEAFARYAQIDLLAVLGEREALAGAVRSCGMRVGADDTWADLFSRVLVEKIEPNLGQGRLTVLCEYPSSEAALARPLQHDPRFAERFEMYACGVELANGFGELTDAQEQRRRFQEEMDEKERVHGERYPLDEDFLAALSIMPPASGVALGFDRLVMLSCGARHIRDVLWTPLT